MNVDIIDQERLLIGAILVNPELISEFNMQPADFGHADSRLYYEAIQETVLRIETARMQWISALRKHLLRNPHF